MSNYDSKIVFYRSDRFRTIDVYRLDANLILEEMLKKQNKNRLFNPDAIYLKQRTELIEFIDFMTEKLSYSRVTFYLAIGIMDAFLADRDINKKILKLICFMSLHLAAKMEENFEKILENEAIRDIFGEKYDIEDIQECELMITKALGYNLNLKTPFSFVEYFLSKGVVSNQDVVRETDCDFSNNMEKFEQTISEFMKITVFNYEVNGYSPAIVAASVILCSRRSQKYRSDWPLDLEKLTGQKIEDIRACANAMSLKNNKIDHLKKSNEQFDQIMPIISPEGMKKQPSIDTLSSFDEGTIDPGLLGPNFVGFKTDEEKPLKNPVRYKSTLNIHG